MLEKSRERGPNDFSTASISNSLRVQRDLMREGYIKIENAICEDTIKLLQTGSDKLIATEAKEAREKVKSLGSIIQLERSPEMLEEVLSERITGVAADLLNAEITFHFGVFFSKPRNSMQTFWHQDFPWWKDKAANDPTVNHIQALIYLDQTNEANGCLRVIPKSHLQKHDLHDFWKKGGLEESVNFTEELRAGKHADPEKKDAGT